MKRDGVIPTALSGGNKTMREISPFNFPSVHPKEPVSAYSPEPVPTGSRLNVLLTLPLRLLQMAIAVTSPSFPG
ncbi:hypothetical protein ABH906_005944 [Pseudomonas frederiksbergensis]